MEGYVAYTIVPPMAIWNSSYIELIGMKYVKILILINLGKKIKEIINNFTSKFVPLQKQTPPKKLHGWTNKNCQKLKLTI